MARTDTWIGLSPRAKALVSDARERVREQFEGAFYNTFPLHTYELPDGRVLNEVIQTDIWAGGPSYFTSLEDAATGTRVPDAEWTNPELADVMGFEVGHALPQIGESETSFFAEFEAAIDAGRVRLHWADQQKYERWKAERSSAGG